MKIFIIGAGAIGKTLAVALKLSDKKVVLVRGSVDDGSRSVEKIEVVTNDGAKLEAEIEVGTFSRLSALDGIIVLTNKSFGNDNLARTLEAKAKNSPLVILQNGLGVERPFIDREFPEVYRCVLFVTSQAISANQIRFKPVTTSPIGMIRRNLAAPGKGSIDRFRTCTNKGTSSHVTASQPTRFQLAVTADDGGAA